ncbi:MAG: GDSL-type esterase/lipase family protein [Lacunisphaera sp.]
MTDDSNRCFNPQADPFWLTMISPSPDEGRITLIILDQVRTQIVFTDLFMPERDGVELMVELRKSAPKLEILTISGDGRGSLSHCGDRVLDGRTGMRQRRGMNCFRMRLPRFVPVGVFAVVGVFASPGVAEEAPAPVPKNISMHFIPAANSHFSYEGRFDFSAADGPVVIWEGSRIGLDFQGPALALRFADIKDQVFFNAQVDGGTPQIIQVPAGKSARIELPVPPAGEWHQLRLFKRTEATAGHATFSGAEIAPVASVRAPAQEKYKLRMEFFGDSIMVGACNEDGATDQWEDHRTHNNALSYTALTAMAFRADYRCIAVSGMGIATGYVEVKAGEVWNRIYPIAGSKLADLSAWLPDVAIINFGENDDAFTRTQHQPFPAGYTEGYIELVRAMRQAYPTTHFVLLRGGMYGGAQSEPLRLAWEAVVKTVEAGDPAISHYVFTHWSSTHPRVVDDRELAEELTAWLKQQPFMRRYL